MPNNNETYITGLRVVKGRKKSQCLNLSNARIKSYAEIEEMTEDELQGVIICPDYPLEDGHLVPSSAIGYEEGTVEDALDDLNEKIGSHRVIATATENQTYLAQLTYLESYYDALSDDEKLHSALLLEDANGFYVVAHIYRTEAKMFVTIGGGVSNIVISSYRLDSNKKVVSSVLTSTVTFVDNTNDTDPLKMNLVVM